MALYDETEFDFVSDLPVGVGSAIGVVYGKGKFEGSRRDVVFVDPFTINVKTGGTRIQ